MKIKPSGFREASIVFLVGLSILSLPLVLVQKVSVAGARFSISYLFISGIFALVLLHGMRHLPKTLGVKIGLAGALPLSYLVVATIFSAINGFDAPFITSAVFWVLFTYLGMQFSGELTARFLGMIRVLTLVVALAGIGLYIVNIPLIDLEMAGGDLYFVNGWGHYRASSVFLNPNSFGYFLVFYFCTAFFARERRTVVSVITFILAAAALFLTGSRSAFVAFAFLLLLLAGQMLNPYARKSFYACINLVFLAALIVLLALSDYMVGADIRFEKWSFSLDIFFRRAWHVLAGIPRDLPLERLGLHFSDNMFLSVLFKVGVIGFLFFLFYYGFILLRALHAMVGGEPRIKVFASFVLVSSVLLFYSNFFYLYPLVLLHGVSVGVLLKTAGRTQYSVRENVGVTQ